MINMNGGYMSYAYTPELVIDNAREKLADVDYDTMVGTGVSGAIIIPQLANALGKDWLIIRKATDKSHSGLPAEGKLGDRWIFVDDFIDSGETKRKVMEGVQEIAESWSYGDETENITYVGDYLYQRMDFYPYVAPTMPSGKPFPELPPSGSITPDKIEEYIAEQMGNRELVAMKMLAGGFSTNMT